MNPTPVTTPLVSTVAKFLAPRLQNALALVPKRAKELVLQAPKEKALVERGHQFVEPTAQELTGMSTSQPSGNTVIPKGMKLQQFQSPGQPQGSWYAPQGATPWESGISPVGWTKIPDPVAPPVHLPGGGVMLPGYSMLLKRKKAQIYQAMANVPAHESTAAPIRDHWSMKPFNMFVETTGLGKQFLIRQKNAMKSITNQ